jgi:hypothetical protein
MKLRLIFEGDEPVPQNLIAEVLRTIDRRLFVHEKRALVALRKEFPQITKEQVTEWRNELDREYRAGDFSMLYIETVQTGSIEYLLIVGAHVVGLVTAKVLSQCLGDGIKGTPVHEELTRHIRYYFMQAQETRLVKAVLDMSRRYNKTPPQVTEVFDETSTRPRRRLLEMTDSSLALRDKSHELRMVKTFVDGATKPLALPSPQPIETLTIKSITAHKPSMGQPILETRIERITVKAPPLTYAQVAEEINKGY